MSEKNTDDVSDIEQSQSQASHDEEVTDSARTSSSKRSVSRSSSSSGRKKKSKYELLDEKWSDKIDKLDKSLDDQFESFVTLLSNK